MGTFVPAWYRGDQKATSSAIFDWLSFTARAGCKEAPDPAMRDFCAVILTSMTWLNDMMLPSESFDWALYGEDMNHCRTGLELYDYDKHHFKLIDW